MRRKWYMRKEEVWRGSKAELYKLGVETWVLVVVFQHDSLLHEAGDDGAVQWDVISVEAFGEVGEWWHIWSGECPTRRLDIGR